LLLLCSVPFLACTLLDDLDELSAGLPSDGVGNGGTSGAGGGGPSGGDAGSGAGGDAGSGAGGDAGSGAGGDAGSASGGDAGDGGSGSAGDAGAGGASAGSGGAGGSAGSGSPDGGVPAKARVFWLQKGTKTVHSLNTDRTGYLTLYTVTGGQSSGLSGIGADTTNARVYFSDELRNRIQSAGFDGSAVVNSLSALVAPRGVDVGGGKLYFSEGGATPRIRRANLDGTVLEPVLTSAAPRGLAVDAAATVPKLYFVDDNLDAIFSADLDGGNVTNLNIAAVTDPVDISIDTEEGMLYWSEASGPKIRRANLDGSNAQDIITTGFSVAAGLEVDVEGRALYFIDGGASGSISSANLDGSGVESFIGSLNDPTSLTVANP